MNISKKALMSFLMALTSLIAMAQPYYHVMKRDGINQTEEAAYNAKKYKIKVDMDGPRPKDAIGGRITIESYECDRSPLKRSFYFTKHGNVYYNNSEGKFYFEESQLDYPKGTGRNRWGYSTYSKDHCGHFRWGRTIAECIDDSENYISLYYDATETDFYFANPDNLPKLQEDLGNEKWAVLSFCEWDYVCKALGMNGWSIDGNRCFLLDLTPDKSLLRAILKENGSLNMTKEQFVHYEAQGLVCLPAPGTRYGSDIVAVHKVHYHINYWSCTPCEYFPTTNSWTVHFSFSCESVGWEGYDRGVAYPVRLVILAD